MSRSNEGVRAALIALGVWFAGAASLAHAFPAYGSNIPNGRVNRFAPASESNTRCWVCHNSAYGGYGTDCSGSSCLNSFGLDFRSTAPGHAAYGWDLWIAAVDSDNDGWSNGEELRSVFNGSTVPANSQYTLPGNPSISCTALPTAAPWGTLRSSCLSEFSAASYSSFATTNRLEPTEAGNNTCDTRNVTHDCATTASCSRSSGDGRGDWDCSCNAGYSGDGHTLSYSHDFTTPNSFTGDDRLYVLRASAVSGCTDINECSGNPCGAGSCSQTSPGSSPGYTCACNSGYRFNGSSCVVHNQCSDVPAVCGVGGTCNELAPPSTYSCTCNSGYVFSGGTCVPNNACVAGLDDCDRNATCTSSSGSSWNCTCNSGWLGTGDARNGTGDMCTDVNECSGRNPCGVGTCNNTPGAYTCSCPSGYRDDGTTCADINECLMAPCGVGGTACTNSAGSYSCTCAAGYLFMGGTCVDIDECASNPCGRGDCSQTAPPGYTCDCQTGYSFDGTTCVDVDECLTPEVSLCAADATCNNTAGSFDCTCNTGYSGDGRLCVDIDECTTGTDDCSDLATCTNTTGSFTCACVVGFEGTGVVCADTDECASGSHTCGRGERCVNRSGTFDCLCAPGLVRLEAGGECVAACGNGERTPGEACDDGNVASGDGCSDECVIEMGWSCFEPMLGAVSECEYTCGDGLVNRTEECDDGDANDDTMPDACRMDCSLAGCGDGVLDTGEECDDGDANSDALAGACRTTCSNAYCGDGIVDEGEVCDPGGEMMLAADQCVVCGGGDAGVDGGVTPGDDGGCGCTTSSQRSAPWAWLALLGFAMWRRRRA